jgi:hypothetical protein
VQVLQHLCGPLRLVRIGQCRESNHDGCVASIDMRDYQHFGARGNRSQGMLQDAPPRERRRVSPQVL